MCLLQANITSISNPKNKYSLFRMIEDFLSAKSDLNGQKDNFFLYAILKKKVTKTQFFS